LDGGTETPAAGDAGGLGETPDADGEEETLLATPGKRNDLQWRRPDKAPYTTPKAKGKEYTPVKSDKRNMGARKRSYKSKYSEETGKNTKRNIHPGLEGLEELSNGIYENLETNYSNKLKEQESQISKNSVEIQNLIESLDNRARKKDKNDG